MTGWYADRMPGRSAKAVIATTLLAFMLVAAVPVTLLVAVVMLLLGYAVPGLALFGGSLLAAAIAIPLAGMTGKRYLRKLLPGESFRAARLSRGQYIDAAEPRVSDYDNVVRLDRSDYTEIH